ncbi:MAG: hypothetical protein R2942_03170 [Ignavibacteria bacterium]
MERDTVINSVSENYSYSAICNDLNFNFKIDVKKPGLISYFTGIDSMYFKGYLEGNLNDSCGVFNLNSKGIIAIISVLRILSLL